MRLGALECRTNIIGFTVKRTGVARGKGSGACIGHDEGRLARVSCGSLQFNKNLDVLIRVRYLRLTAV